RQVAREDRRGLRERFPVRGPRQQAEARRGAAAQVSAVHDVVVHERRHVKDLDGSACTDDLGAVDPAAAEMPPETEERTQTLAPGAEQSRDLVDQREGL